MKSSLACAVRACIAMLLVSGGAAAADLSSGLRALSPSRGEGEADPSSGLRSPSPSRGEGDGERPAAASVHALTLARAIELTRAGNPQIAAFVSQSEAMQRRADSAALPANDVLEAEFENFAGTGNFSGVRALESTLRLSRVLELGGKPQLRRGVGAAEIEHLAVEQQSRRMDILAETARRFVHLLADQEYLAAAERATELAQRIAEVVRERVEAGAASPAELNRAEIGIARAQLLEEHAEHELASSRVRLAVMWGSRNPEFGQASGRLFELPAVEPLAAYQSRLEANPDLLAFVSQARLREARLRSTAAQRRPDLTVSLGVRRLEAFDEQALVAGFSLPLGVRRRADLEAHALHAERRRLDHDFESRRLELHALLFELYQELLHASAAAQTFSERIRPRARAMLDTVHQGFLAGRFSLLELADAQRQLLEIDREAARAAADFHTYLIDIERLTGEPVRPLAGGKQP